MRTLGDTSRCDPRSPLRWAQTGCCRPSTLSPRVGTGAGARAEAQMADNVGFISSLYDAWNVRDLDAQADATAPDGVITIVGTGDVFEGPEGTRKYAQSWVSGFPDGQVMVDNILADGDRLVV